jgi:NAD(P)-dependent dehydrogenase (short-subunit alcohol dehydrogenase family)
MTSTPAPVALVTGASRGIGRAIAQALAGRGAFVAVHFQKNRAAAKAVLAGLPGAGHQVFAADISTAAGCAGLIEAVMGTFGQLDVLVNNAGIYEPHELKDLTFAGWQERWQRTIATNLDGPAHLSFLAAGQMLRQAAPVDAARGRGRIVNISSRGAFRGEPTAPAYGAAKAGLNALGQSLAKALAPEGIYVFTLAPGWVDTDMAAPHLRGPRAAEILAQHPLGRVATPAEVGAAAAWLALDAPAAMTGCIIDLNGASYLRT